MEICSEDRLRLSVKYTTLKRYFFSNFSDKPYFLALFHLLVGTKKENHNTRTHTTQLKNIILK